MLNKEHFTFRAHIWMHEMRFSIYDIKLLFSDDILISITAVGANEDMHHDCRQNTALASKEAFHSYTFICNIFSRQI
ncbi:CLUMA_CG010411, isoform A [Clunio marinus]|uniref:CLUMA_CG010411, isoform A n=1 Tax=Clunio marinus TaxID=568069 RepID=A0A1J1IBB6_9DIPT|nr:CLUMA_CG010411, isoform A [Clunio marinus]